MHLTELVRLLRAEILTPAGDTSKEITAVHASDLISRVLAGCSRGALWVTGLLDSQIVNAAELFDLSGIVFVNNRRPSVETIEQAMKEGILMLCTELTMFETCGILYKHGLIPAKRA